MPGLEQYQRKRDFRGSPEPRGSAKRTGTGSRHAQASFVVHKHAARRLHYDLRLEHGGVLESWAVPKGPPMEPGQKRLAVRVEDHPLEYGDFEGVIPAGHYGAGTVMVWDRGHYEVRRRSAGRIDFVLHGQKLKGRWSLVHMAGRDADHDNWLLIRPRQRPDDDAAAVPADLSVATGRSMKQIAAQAEAPADDAGSVAAKPAAPRPQTLPAARSAALPREPRPQLATLSAEAPTGSGWLHEIKFDGYRILAALSAGRARLLSRNGKDWTSRFPNIARRLGALPVGDALLDGELVALESDGTSSFRRLQDALGRADTDSVVYQIFDLLHLDGFDLRPAPLAQRKRALAELLDTAATGDRATLRYTEHIEGQGPDFYAQVCRLGLEGMVSKRSDARYRGGRSRAWLKVKCTRHEELVIGGYTAPRGSRTGFGALLLGAWRGARLVYAGKVGTGFSQRQLATLLARLQKLEVPDSPFHQPPAQAGVRWVRPRLVAEVEFSEWTRDGLLRHPTYRGLREDRDAARIRLSSGSDGVAAAAAGRRDGKARVAGVTLSNAGRVLYPQQGVTKLALARYYEAIADWILPSLSDRPLSLLRCPRGRGKQCFFQKHPGEVLAKLPRLSIAEKHGEAAEYVYVRSLPDLVALVQAGTLELHTWGSRVGDVERPDLLVFDLDPAPEVGWSEVRRQARALRERLAALGLASFVRITGGKGLHLVVPLVARAGWEEAKAFARAVAQAHARDDPGRLTANLSKARRRGRIFIDYLRNGRGATAIASYSTRARQGAPVAVPLRWDELGAAMRPDRYNIDQVRRRLSSLHADPWQGFEEARRPLDAALLKELGVAGRSGR
jgi:bifunctional non-homologous end joining protein LigD